MLDSTEIVIVGAGAAGLAAARTLRDQDIPYILLEAKPQVGGRAVCDKDVFGFPYDLGGFWLCDDGENPLVPAAQELGFDISNNLFPFPNMPMLLGDQWESEAQNAARLAYNTTRFDAMEAVDPKASDQPVAALTPTDPQWEPILDVWFAIVQNGYQSDLSAVDLARALPGPYLQVKEGLGELLRAWAGDVSVQVNCPVHAITVQDDGVIVQTNRGDIAARGVIVTTSLGVLTQGAIQFDPPLPAKITEAAAQLPMGNVNRIAVQFDHDIFGTNCPPAFGQYVAPDDCVLMLTRLAGQNVALGYVGGDFADALEDEPEDASIALVCRALQDALGRDVSPHIIATHCTRWRADPWTKGGYTIARPHCADARQVLRAPVHDKIFLAGEATSPTQFAQVHGAMNEGSRAARDAAKMRAGRTE